MGIVRQTYVISDLHLGGNYAANDEPGFRLCTQVSRLTAFVDALRRKDTATELVINGDLVDFLAEGEGSPPEWTPFLSDPDHASRRLERIIARDRNFFEALARFLERGHRLVLLLGNHDLELALPAVRRTLLKTLDVTGRKDFQFICDGEAYVVGDSLIEHGNRYDRWNTVDHDALRRLRSWQSRNQPASDAPRFEPPAGSQLVCEVINPIKTTYRFIDLLKPESDVVIPLLMALEPDYRSVLGRLARLSTKAWRHRMTAAAQPRPDGDIAAFADLSDGDYELYSARGVDRDGYGGDLAATPATARGSGETDLRAALERVMGADAETFLDRIAEDDISADLGGDISSFSEAIDRRLGLVRLFAAGRGTSFERRLRALLQALRVLQNDRTFDTAVETLPGYLEAASDLAKGGFRFVLFGHTHLRRRIPLDDGATYLNTGELDRHDRVSKGHRRWIRAAGATGIAGLYVGSGRRTAHPSSVVHADVRQVGRGRERTHRRCRFVCLLGRATGVIRRGCRRRGGTTWTF